MWSVADGLSLEEGAGAKAQAVFAARSLGRVCGVRRVRRAVCVAVLLFVFVVFLFWTTVLHTVRHRYDCTEYHSRLFLDELCHNYSKGIVSGSLCKPVCEGKIKVSKCLGHGVKLHVLLAEWNGDVMVMKYPKILGHSRSKWHIQVLDGQQVTEYSISKEDFVARANDSYTYNLRTAVPLDRAILENLFDQCDWNSDGVLHYPEAVVCWQLVETDEYIFYTVLSGNPAMPKLYGTCGAMYSMEFASNKGLDQFLYNTLLWEEKVQLAVALIELAESLHDTPYGTVHLCDVQESNFGFVQENGRLVAKAIDMDISFFEKSLVSAISYEKGNSCETDEDCSFISCYSQCTAKGCSGVLNTNNLQTMCSKIFSQQHTHHVALLDGAPSSIVLQLKELLYKCVHPPTGSLHLDGNLANQLKSLLLSTTS